MTSAVPPSTGAERLRAMHDGPRPLVLPNVWDAASARAFTEAGFGALATSSSAVAATLGHADGHTPGAEMLAAVAAIARSVDVPVTADIETGYGLAPGELAGRLLQSGLAGCNLEDSDPVSRARRDPAEQADFLAAVRAAAGSELVINARVDVFVRPLPGEADAVEAAVLRARAYLAAGADCVYPILAPPASLPRLVSDIGGPVNAMWRRDGPALAELARTGVARITFGGGLHARVMRRVGELASQLAAEAARIGGSGPAQRQ
jgi:2-methylisocitrate lyase-like PEP mutase family enzyme